MSRLFTNGTPSIVQVSPNATIDNQPARTYMAWMKVTEWLSDNDYVWVMKNLTSSIYFYCNVVDGVTWGTSYHSLLNADTDARLDDAVIADAMQIGVWKHVAVTFDNATDKKLRLYLNGVEISVYAEQQAAAGALLDDSSAPLVVGGYTYTSFYSFSGLMYDFRFYDASLTAGQIATIVAGGHTVDPVPANNKCHLTFFTDDGSTEPDASGNNNTGAITAATFSQDNPIMAYSFPDTRDYATFPNDSVDIQGTLHYTVPADLSHAAPVDSRTAGAPSDCRLNPPNVPLNSRTNPPF